MDQTIKLSGTESARSAVSNTGSKTSNAGSKTASNSSKGKLGCAETLRSAKDLMEASAGRLDQTVRGEELELTSMWRSLQERDWEDLKVEAQKTDPKTINWRESSFGWCAGHFAASAGVCHALKVLSDSKARIDLLDNEGNTMLMLACRSGHLQTAQFLVSKKAEMDSANRNGWTSLMWVAMNGQEDLASWMLDASTDINQADHEGMTACMWAARHGHYGIIEVFLACGLNLLARDHSGLTVLDHCSEHLHMAATVAAIGEIDEHLHGAAQRNDVEGAIEAIEAGADVDLRDGDGWTPLMWAALNNSIDMVQLIVRYGAKPTLLDENCHVIDQLQTHHLAVGEEIERILGANDRLLAAAQDNNWDQAAEELAIGAFINVRDECHRTSLMFAAKHCCAEGVHMLLSKNAHVNDRDSFGWAAVHYAVIERSRETVSMFHFLGADMTVKTYEGDGLLHMAVRADDALMIQVLLAAGLDTEDVDINLFTPLMMAAYNGLVNAVQTLIAYGAYVEAKSTDAFGGRGAMALAVTQGHEAAVAATLQPVQVPPKLGPEVVAETKSAKVPKAKAPAPAPSPEPTAKSNPAPKAPSAKKLSSAAPKQSVSAKAKVAASGVVARKKNIPKTVAKVEFRSENPMALIEEAVRRRGEQPWKTVSAPAKMFIKQVDGCGNTALALAVKYRKMSIGTLLLQAKADPNAADDDGNTILMQAVSTKQKEVVETMMAAGARLEKQNKLKQTCFDVCEDEDIRHILGHRAALNMVPASDPDWVAEKEDETAKAKEKAAKFRAQFRVRVENLPLDETALDLEGHVRMLLRKNSVPNPERIKIMTDPITGGPRGHAYCEFLDPAALDLAVHANGGYVQGQSVRVIKEPRVPIQK